VEGSGSSFMNGYEVDIPLTEIKKQAEEQQFSISYCQGYEMAETRIPTASKPDALMSCIANNFTNAAKWNIL